MNVDDFSRSKKLKIICSHKKNGIFGKALEINQQINLPVIYITSMKILLYPFYYLGSSAGEMLKKGLFQSYKNENIRIVIFLIITPHLPQKINKNFYTISSFPQIFGITNQCPESTTTVHYVNSCPQSAEKWTEAAKRLNCQNISTNCTNFVYHCVMDHYRTTLIEVCAPKKLILGIYGVLVFFFSI